RSSPEFPFHPVRLSAYLFARTSLHVGASGRHDCTASTPGNWGEEAPHDCSSHTRRLPCRPGGFRPLARPVGTRRPSRTAPLARAAGRTHGCRHARATGTRTRRLVTAAVRRMGGDPAARVVVRPARQTVAPTDDRSMPPRIRGGGFGGASCGVPVVPAERAGGANELSGRCRRHRVTLLGTR